MTWLKNCEMVAEALIPPLCLPQVQGPLGPSFGGLAPVSHGNTMPSMAEVLTCPRQKCLLCHSVSGCLRPLQLQPTQTKEV